MTTSSSDRPSADKPAAAKPASAYSRFIPREELGSFAAWSPGSLNDAAPPAAPAAADASVQAQIAAARQAGYQDGCRDGLAALDSFKQSFAAQMAAQVGTLLESFDSQIAALEQQIAHGVAQTAVMLARRVVRAELHSHPEQVAHAAQQAIEAVLLSARHIRVSVHPDDFALVSSGAADALQSRGARLLANPELTRGGCLVESDLGRIDATIETRWQQAAAVLGSDLPWHDGVGTE